MKMFLDIPQVYLHRLPVDFRKSINGLALLVEQQMALSPFSGALFVFCNRRRDKIKVLYWDSTGFCLWYKRLEQQRFRWPARMEGDTLILDEQQWHWLLEGIDITKMKRHTPLSYTSVG
ncbi:TPA: IS66 family insertion sequence element accessory protein TnpB [Salmonella enterica subsp. enterica serovar Hvittingfoss]|nr:IS66 family insertion sequence element accessory protein TnpB [Salmonella enterica subsp. diarizonae]EIG0952301.1 IS66 family insertion sequence element accessory protein TnpB [Salmonella enterica subsp. enterica serovar Muenchen]HEA0252136.1 IS66 family insertion sequence element accessory protein TnpB [Salmonella enterica]HEB6949808.1 IS66 family insertion sequence element accessory protein TnpB [Salmonella enterica subsp. enterica serovar Hvittingfoss]EDQ5534155.1 IS66 family insertion se